MAGFTLTSFAFPVAPATLVGFVVPGFAWVDVAPVVVAAPNRVEFALPVVTRREF